MDAAKELISLFEKYSSEKVERIEALKAHASQRKICRIVGPTKSVIGVENDDTEENKAFIYFSKHFRSHELPVPEVYATDRTKRFYIQEDLGDTTLYDVLFSKRGDSDPFPLQVEHLYYKAVTLLPRFQVEAGSTIDYNKCHGFESFSKDLMLSDMHYFREQYLDRINFNYDHSRLEEEFIRFAAYLAQAEDTYFLYRDFQSRNIMIKDDKPYFIDYQGGCKGALQYDVASLLFQAQARIPSAARERILGVYLNALAGFIDLDRHKFLSHFHAFVVLRIMQVLGTYGLRGLKEGKQYFKDSINFALVNLRYIYRTQGLPVAMPEFERFINSLHYVKEEKLTLTIYSFSYKLATEVPFNPHGGGFVFDSRCLPNPGREKEYKHRSGLDEEVINYLKGKEEVDSFFKNVTAVVDQAVQAYMRRKFLSLSVAFGCTGGQHRSVFLAEALAAYMRKKYDINVLVHHLARDQWVKEIK